MSRFPRTVLALAAFLIAGSAAGAEIERIEPPFWWTGMQHRQVQLMVHGKDVGRAQPALAYPGVRIVDVARTDNPNYLFVTLDIGARARPGTLSLRIGGARADYRLLAREPGSSQRRGFSSKDAILLLMPDRWANGDRSNDVVPGYPDKLDRASNDAGRHGGDIKGIADSLDYIAGMGWTQVWPTPLVENNQPQYSYHGYAATDTYRIDPRFGSNEDYRALVAKARGKGIGIIQDIVLNHVGSSHWWTRDMPSRDWFTNGGKFVATQHARTTAGDPYAAQVDKDNFTQGWFVDTMPDMNQRNPLVANYQIQNTIWWIEYAGLSGVREDTYGYSDAAFLAEWSRRVMREYPNFNIVGEEWSDNPVVVARWLRGAKNRDGYVSHMPSMMDFPLQGTLTRALTAEDGMHSGLAWLYGALVNDTLYPDPSALVLFEGNHDVPRLYSILDEDLDLVKMALAYVATMPRIPQFYYGTELLMTSKKHRDDGSFRHGFPGGWPGDKVNAFTGEGLSAKQRDAQGFLRRLLNWRKARPVIHAGKLTHYTPADGVYVYFRYDKDQRVMVVINKNKAETRLETGRFREMLAGWREGVDALTGRRYAVDKPMALPARSVLVLDLAR